MDGSSGRGGGGWGWMTAPAVGWWCRVTGSAAGLVELYYYYCTHGCEKGIKCSHFQPTCTQLDETRSTTHPSHRGEGITVPTTYQRTRAHLQIPSSTVEYNPVVLKFSCLNGMKWIRLEWKESSGYYVQNDIEIPTCHSAVKI